MGDRARIPDPYPYAIRLQFAVNYSRCNRDRLTTAAFMKLLSSRWTNPPVLQTTIVQAEDIRL